MYCKNCGTEQKEGQKFCPKCGTPYLIEEVSTVEELDVPMEPSVHEKSPQSDDIHEPSKKLHNNYLMYALIAVLLVVAGVMGYNSCGSHEKERVIGSSYDYGEVKAISLQQIIYIAKKGMDKAEISEFIRECGFEDSGEQDPYFNADVCTTYFFSGRYIMNKTFKEASSVDFFNLLAFVHKRKNKNRPNSYEFNLLSSYADYFDMLANDLKADIKESGTSQGRLCAEKKIKGMKVRIVKDNMPKYIKHGIYDVKIYIDR